VTAPTDYELARAERLGRATAHAGRALSMATCPFDANGTDDQRVLARRFVTAYVGERPDGAVDYGESPEPDDAMPDGARALLSAFDRVAGKDTHPGGESLHAYWTTGPGLAKWLGRPHEWTALYHHLLSHMDGNELLAKATASKWFAEVKGHPVGEEKGKNPFGPG
jgi:hypothetical protein